MAEAHPRLTPAPLPRGVGIYDRPARRFGATQVMLALIVLALMVWLFALRGR